MMRPKKQLLTFILLPMLVPLLKDKVSNKSSKLCFLPVMAET